MMLLSKTGVGAIRGASLIALITSCCSAGFLLFGYDQGNARPAHSESPQLTTIQVSCQAW